MTGYDSLLIRKCIFADVFISRHHCVICTHLSITCSLTVINSIYPDQFDFVLFLNWNTKNKIWINNDSIIFVMGAKCCHFIPYYWIYYQWRVYICLGSWSLNCYGGPIRVSNIYFNQTVLSQRMSKTDRILHNKYWV